MSLARCGPTTEATMTQQPEETLDVVRGSLLDTGKECRGVLSRRTAQGRRAICLSPARRGRLKWAGSDYQIMRLIAPRG